MAAGPHRRRRSVDGFSAGPLLPVYTGRMPRRRHAAIALGVGMVTGIFSGLLGIGGGLIIIAGLTRWLHTTQHEAHGSSLVAVIPIAVVGSVYLTLQQQAMGRELVHWPIAVVIGVASIVGAPLGAYLAHQTSGAILRRIVAVTAFAVAASMFARAAGWL